MLGAVESSVDLDVVLQSREIFPPAAMPGKGQMPHGGLDDI